MALSGTVKFYNKDKGFGFIKPSDGGPDAFVHATVVKAAGLEILREDEEVVFETAPGKDGRPRATSIKVS